MEIQESPAHKVKLQRLGGLLELGNYEPDVLRKA
jgi:hypothetical protein